MSVEAALVVPAAIFGIVLRIYIAFFVHSRCILSQDVYILGFRSGLFSEKQGYGNAVQYITDHEAEQTKDSYFGSSKPDIKAMQNGNEVKVEGITTTNHDALFGYLKGAVFLDAGGVCGWNGRYLLGPWHQDGDPL